MTTETVPNDLTRKLAWSSIVANAIGWLPILFLLIKDPFDPKPRNEIQGWAAVSAWFSGIGLLCFASLLGAILAVIALRRQSGQRIARVGLAINLLPLVGVAATVFVMVVVK